MRKLSTREYVLIVLLGVVAIVLFYYNRGGGLGVGTGNAQIGDDMKLGEPPRVRLDRLARTLDSYDPEGRDLFAYYTPPPPKQEVVRRPAPPPVERPPQQQRVARPTPPPRQTGPTPPAINFTYLGYLGPKDNKIAVFEDGQDVMLARAGDVVKDQFRVVEFGYEAIVMGYVDERFKDQTSELRQKAGAAQSRGRGRR
jgi:hypothetical protein